MYIYHNIDLVNIPLSQKNYFILSFFGLLKKTYNKERGIPKNGFFINTKPVNLIIEF
ncbi:hypothetical protein RIR_e67731_A0A2N1N4L7_9GLOM [Rhizophagus irregularis DAOM 181602=DAOM 197198]|nr:hypothetical protein RIR_e67731_A0A2N1N4L7_9GLOM [Rhizophagus irregularis DAOM 181602=DAOM 197198]